MIDRHRHIGIDGTGFRQFLAVIVALDDLRRIQLIVEVDVAAEFLTVILPCKRQEPVLIRPDGVETDHRIGDRDGEFRPGRTDERLVVFFAVLDEILIFRRKCKFVTSAFLVGNREAAAACKRRLSVLLEKTDEAHIKCRSHEKSAVGIGECA